MTDGKICYDGIDIDDIKKDDLRHSLGVVLQDTNLFTGTVMEKIRYGKLDASDEECKMCIRDRHNTHLMSRSSSTTFWFAVRLFLQNPQAESLLFLFSQFLPLLKRQCNFCLLYTSRCV